MLKSKIMARIIAFGVLILLILTCGCLAGCEDNTSEGEYQFPDPYDMPRKLRRDVEKAVQDRDGTKFPGWEVHGDGKYAMILYCGNYNGAVVMQYEVQLGGPPPVAGYFLRARTDVYYDGEIVEIHEAYERGWLSQADIAKIYEIQQADLFAHDY